MLPSATSRPPSRSALEPRLYPASGRACEPRLPFDHASPMMPAMTLPPVRYAAACALFGVFTACAPGKPPLHSTAGLAQGTTYSLQWSGGAADVDEVERAAGAELDRIDALLSNYRSDSTIERFNAAQTVEPQQLPAELV